MLCAACLKKLLYHKKFKAKNVCVGKNVKLQGGGVVRGKIIAQQLNKRIMPNPAVN